MFDPKADLVSHFCQARLARVEPDLSNLTTADAQDPAALQAILDAWISSEQRPFPGVQFQGSLVGTGAWGHVG